MTTSVSARDFAPGVAAAAAMFVALVGAALLAAAVWLKLTRPECLNAA